RRRRAPGWRTATRAARGDRLTGRSRGAQPTPRARARGRAPERRTLGAVARASRRAAWSVDAAGAGADGRDRAGVRAGRLGLRALDHAAARRLRAPDGAVLE